ncbi:MAG: helix-turn-helix domain-containing protein [Clostridia bacterium]|nr:helix-turn-helix domain-containing protein [Clostridia bacterium]
MDHKLFKDVVAQNIFYLRTKNHMTQYELGEKLNYSDKAISKWERGDAIPDVFVLKKIADLFEVTVDYILVPHSEQDQKRDTKPIKKIKNIIAAIAAIGVQTVALAIFVIVALYTDGALYLWQIFIYALPVIAIVELVFACIWSRKMYKIFLSVSLLLWGILLTVYFAIADYSMWMIFLLGIPIQLIIFFAFGIKITIKFSQKDHALIKKGAIKNSIAKYVQKKKGKSQISQNEEKTDE